MTLSAASVTMILFAAENKGANFNELCQWAAIDPAVLSNPDARIPIRQAQQVWEKAIETTSDPLLPLHIGEALNPSTAGIVAYVMLNCPTLGKALEKLCLYQDIVCEGSRTSFEVKDKKVYLKLELLSSDIIYPRIVIDSEFSIYVHFFKALIGREFLLKEVRFGYPHPGDTSEHERIFPGAALFFDATVSALVFDEAYLQVPVMNAHPELFVMFEKYAADYLAKYRQQDTLTFQVKREITQLLKGEEPGIENVARNLAMSVRSLQAKLREENTTYQLLLDSVRKELAMQHLRDFHLSIADVAYLLGFSDPSVFFRSFKKWTGITPRAFRLQPTISG